MFCTVLVDWTNPGSFTRLPDCWLQIWHEYKDTLCLRQSICTLVTGLSHQLQVNTHWIVFLDLSFVVLLDWNNPVHNRLPVCWIQICYGSKNAVCLRFCDVGMAFLLSTRVWCLYVTIVTGISHEFKGWWSGTQSDSSIPCLFDGPLVESCCWAAGSRSNSSAWPI